MNRALLKWVRGELGALPCAAAGRGRHTLDARRVSAHGHAVAREALFFQLLGARCSYRDDAAGAQLML